MRGLDPRIHDEAQQCEAVLPAVLLCFMDCRVLPSLAWASYGKASKPGNDG